MRLYRFINESGRYEELDLYVPDIAKIISQNCKKYLKDTKGKWFQKSMEIRLGPKIPAGYKTVRQDRRSLGMAQDIANKFNKWLVKNGHADRSKSVMCSRDGSEMFGRPFYVFIEGDYKYTWVDAHDINTDTEATGWYSSMVDEFLNMDKYDSDFWGPPHLKREKEKKWNELMNLGVPLSHSEWDKIREEHNEKVKEWLKKTFASFFHTNKGIHMAYANNAEIWFQCKGYYFVKDDITLIDQLKRTIK